MAAAICCRSCPRVLAAVNDNALFKHRPDDTLAVFTDRRDSRDVVFIVHEETAS